MQNKGKNVPQKILLTKKGLDDLKKEYEDKKEKIIKLNDDINRARNEGDLSENGAYSAAILEKQVNESRIAELMYILDNYEIVEHANLKSNIVQIGSFVKILSTGGTEKSFTIVGSNEADPLEGKISIDSPIGKALIGKKKGEKVVATTEQSSITYDIIEVKN